MFRSSLKWLPWVLVLVLAVLYVKKEPLTSSFSNAKEAQIQTAPKPGLRPAVASYHDAVAAASPAVVNIFTTQHVQQSPLQKQMLEDPFFRQFFGLDGQNMPQQQRDATSLGSGVIVSQDGYILTNNHVIDKADEIVVALQDGRKAKAKVIGTDPDSDLAVIQITLDHLPILPFRSDEPLVGDVVLAIGNPFGVGQTVTEGIISATKRSGLGINTFENFLQTDAAINPGNSGGALIDTAGNLLGINTAIFSQSGGSMGIGFAIPVSLAQQVMQSILKEGRVVRGWLGVEIKGMSNTDDILSTKDPMQKGVLISGIINKGPADQSGLRPGDRVLTINQQTISQPDQLVTLIAQTKPGKELQLLVVRDDKQIKLEVVVGERPANPTANLQEDKLSPFEQFFGKR